MRALVLHKVGDQRVERVPRPMPGPRDVLVRVRSCGVCGSDIPRTFVRGAYSFPTICGHEFAGHVEEVGSEVTGYSQGDRVAVFPLIWCDRCPACEAGEYAQCADYDYLGSRSDGAFAEYVVAPARNLLAVPESVPLDSAAMTEPAAVALHALRRVPRSLVGETVAVLGAGPIGLLVAQWARISGAATVIVFDLIEDKLAMARDLGFTHALNGREVDAVACVRELTAGHGAAVCVEAAGVPATLKQCIAAAKPGGSVVMLGNPSGDVTLPAPLISQAMRAELALYGTWNSSFSSTGRTDDWHTALSAVANGSLKLEPLVTHRVNLAEAFEALLMMRDQSEFYCKVLIQP